MNEQPHSIITFKNGDRVFAMQHVSALVRRINTFEGRLLTVKVWRAGEVSEVHINPDTIAEVRENA